MSSISNTDNIYNYKEAEESMKKRVVITLDSDVSEAIDFICKEDYGSKRSTVINTILRTHLESKKKVKKK